MPVYHNLDGTTATQFKIGKGGVTVYQGSSTPGGVNGDFWLDPAGEVKAKVGGTWQLIHFDNISLAGNTISSTDTNGDINVLPNGTGNVVLGTAGGGTSTMTAPDNTNVVLQGGPATAGNPGGDFYIRGGDGTLGTGDGNVIIDVGNLDLSSNNIINGGDISATTFTGAIAGAVGYSILAKATTGAGNYASLVAGTNGVLRRDGTGNIAFGTLVTGNIGDSQITYAKIQNGAGFDIMAKVGTGAGAYASLAAGTDSILMRSGSGNLTFGTVVTNQIGASQVTYAKIQSASAGYTIMAKAGTGAGAYAELAAGANGVLRRSGTGDLAFGTLVSANIGANQVALSNLAQMATASVYYRKTAATGNVEVQTLATLKTDLGLTGTNSGDNAGVTSVTGGTGIASTGGNTPSLSLTVDELAEKTGAVVGTDRLVGTTGTTNWAETISGIPLSIFNNDSGWNNYSLPYATSTVIGGIELFSDTDQSVAANTVSTTASRTYGIQLNAANQAVVNVPWTDTTYSANQVIDWTNATQNLVTTGTGNIGGALTTNNSVLTDQNVFFTGAFSLTEPKIQFDATGDCLSYDRVANTFHLRIANVSEYSFSATASDFGNSSITTTGAISGSNLSGTNTGDNATNTQYSGLVSDTGVPALLSSGGLPVLNAGITGAEVRTAIGAGTSSTTGTVTSTSVVTANGVSGTVATSTTTPAITLTVDHDAISNFVANEHINWTSTSQNLSTSGGITGNNYIVGSASGGISNSINNGYIYYAGGNSSLAGANIWMYGGTHASQANDFVFKGSTTTALQYDHSATTWDFQSNAITTSGSATAGSLILSGTITRTADNSATTIYGGTAASWLSQSGIEIYGSGFPSVANDIVFFGTSVDEKLRWDNSAGTWIFYYPINADTINEKTAAAGVTIEGVLHKDNDIYPRAAFIDNQTLTTQDSFIMYGASPTLPVILYDQLDYQSYDRTTNTFAFKIGNADQFTLSATTANFQDNSITTTGEINNTGGANDILTNDLLLKEHAYSATAVGGYGTLWVENTAPTKLWYRDDTGSDFQLGVNLPVNHGTAYPASNLGYTGVIENFITGATVTAGYAVALMADTVRAEVQHADADVLAPPVGIAITGGTAGTKIDVLVKGTVYLTGVQYGVGAGAVAYVSATAGYITPTVPATTGQYVFIMGYGLATDVMYVNPQFNWVEVS